MESTENKRASAHDESLSLREIEKYILECGFSVFSVGAMVRAVGNAILDNKGITDSRMIRVKRSDVDAFLTHCFAASVNRVPAGIEHT